MTSARLRPLAFAFVSAFSIATEAPLAADTCVTTVAPAANYGATVNLNVGSGATALLRFDLAALPERAMPSNLLKATLVLYVNGVGVAGSIDVGASSATLRLPGGAVGAPRRLAALTQFASAPSRDGDSLPGFV
jgi:hypothetical protein